MSAEVTRSAASRILRETALLLELRGESPFRARAYENAARVLEGQTEELHELLSEGRLSALPGIGSGLAAALAEIAASGSLGLHDELRAALPSGVLELFRVPGLGAKKIRTLIERLGVGSLEELEAAATSGRLAELPGFGARTAEGIVKSLADLRQFRHRLLLPEAERLVGAALAELRALSGVVAAESAGELRRGLETVGDLMAVCAAPSSERAAVAEQGRGFAELRLELVDPEAFVGRWVATTGSPAHFQGLAARAQRLGLRLDDDGLWRGDQRVPCATEAELYRNLELPWIPPELREGRDELELAAARALPDLVRDEQIRGTLHVHSTWSDGKAEIREMAQAARALGWSYLGIADHSPAAAYAGGMSVERVRAQWREIEELNRATPGFTIFRGIECDILADGALDFADELLLGFDFVVASVHSRFRMSREEMTARMVRAVGHPAVTFLGHPTGRLLLARAPYEVDLEAVLEAAAANGTIVELNANPHRLDLDWRELPGWVARGLPTSIHPDAHSPDGLRDVRWGVMAARKGGLTAAQVFNTQEADAVERYFADRRRRAAERLGMSAPERP